MAWSISTTSLKKLARESRHWASSWETGFWFASHPHRYSDHRFLGINYMHKKCHTELSIGQCLLGQLAWLLEVNLSAVLFFSSVGRVQLIMPSSTCICVVSVLNPHTGMIWYLATHASMCTFLCEDLKVYELVCSHPEVGMSGCIRSCSDIKVIKLYRQIPWACCCV